jgi:serine/threonine protein kinase/tetratricopeptide (TPR) repeat protein
MSEPNAPFPEQQAKEIFSEAIDLRRAQRDAFVNERCGQNAALRAAVGSLLAAYDRAGSFLAGPTLQPGQGLPVDSALPPLTQIGSYRLLNVIGEGGFGTVYLAEQEHPIRRRVALKLIKLGMDTRQVIARFEAERQALAMMDHPNIAKVFDAGATGNGRPYFVMELVEGVPITRWCDEHRLTARQRLELFIPVCQAVQHAHQKGIIHRDLKPNNVLVILQDGKPMPKVIDFGIAKATEGRLTERTVFTEMRQLIGTPEYMSPEQADIGATDIDTRADVYSLGVLLYELLTGTTPFDPRDLRSKAYAEIQRVIREVDPPRPSTRLSTMLKATASGPKATASTRDTIASVAAQRRIEPGKLSTFLRGELDWIVMKCLEKDRARRYETASALASDVARYLADEPVAAGPPSAVYRFRKLVHRHKGPALASAAVLLVLIAGVIGTTIGLIRESRQRAISEQHRAEAVTYGIEAERQRAEAQKSAQEAKQQAAIAQAVSDFQSGMLASADPDKLLGDKVTVFRVVTAAVKELDAGKLKDQPLVEAAVRQTIGNTLRALGRYDQAEPNLRKAVELRRESLSARAPELAESLCNLAWMLRDRGMFTDAEGLVRQALDIFRGEGDERNVAATLSGLAVLLEDQGKRSDAEPLLRESLAIRRKILPADHRDIGRNLHNLATSLYEQGKFDEAEPVFREALEVYRTSLPAGHPDVAVDLNNLGMLLMARHKLDEAESLLRQALAMRRSALPEGHQDIAGSLVNLALLLRDEGKLEEAEQLARQGLEMFRKALPAGHAKIGTAASNLAKVLHREGKFADAEPLYREAIGNFERQFGKDHQEVGLNRFGLGVALAKMNRFAEAEAELLEGERVLAISSNAIATRQCREALVGMYTDWDKAEPGKGYGQKAQQWKERLPTSKPATTQSGIRAHERSTRINYALRLCMSLAWRWEM